MRYSIFICISLMLLASCGRISNQEDSEASGLKYVNTLIGTNSNRAFSHGNTYPAVTRPWGMNVWTPQTGLMDDPWVYTYQSDSIRGFKQTHVPSPWIGDHAAFSIMPVAGPLRIRDTERASRFYHTEETATPYYYAVHLEDYDVDAEITATERCGFLRFSFNDKRDRFIVLDAFHQGSHVKIIPEERKIVGFCKNNTGGVPDNFANYFVIVFDTDFSDYGVWDEKDVYECVEEVESSYAGAYLRFGADREQVCVKVSSSYISLEQAEYTLEREVGNQDFRQVKDKSKSIWDELMGRIRVEGGTEEQKRTFYSNLYRVSLYPRKFYEYDNTGEAIYYSPYDGRVHKGYMFSDNGFWDTFRSAHPFYTLLFPELTGKLMQALINIYEEGGWLPNWISPGYRNSMIGAHAISLMSDAYVKGIRDFDARKALEAVRKECSVTAPQVFMGRYGWESYNKLGYIPYPDYSQAVAMTLEYAYDDYCAMRLAESLGETKQANFFRESARNYRNVYDPVSGFMRPRMVSGKWHEPFDPYRWGGPYTEGNAIQYSWSVFHDVQGLIDLMGGKEPFVSMLDSIFTRPPRFSLYDRSFNEIAEMHHAGIGQYAHGNQPAQHIPYLYAYAGEVWKTQRWVRKIMDCLYDSSPDGYCGDEDNGQTSSWYLFSALGFYPVCPGSGEYVIGSPLFTKVTVALPNGKEFVINAPENSEKNRFINQIYLNDEVYSPLFIRHDDILRGGSMSFEMTSDPQKNRYYKKGDYPYSLSVCKK